jgi:hypothetical protein
MSIPIKRPKKEYKQSQLVWLNYDIAMWVWGKANEMGVAPNIFIAKLLEGCMNAEKEGKFTPIAHVDREIKVYACPYCEYEARVRGDLLQHLLDKHSDKLKIEGK